MYGNLPNFPHYWMVIVNHSNRESSDTSGCCRSLKLSPTYLYSLLWWAATLAIRKVQVVGRSKQMLVHQKVQKLCLSVPPKIQLWQEGLVDFRRYVQDRVLHFTTVTVCHPSPWLGAHLQSQHTHVYVPDVILLFKSNRFGHTHIHLILCSSLVRHLLLAMNHKSNFTVKASEYNQD